MVMTKSPGITALVGSDLKALELIGAKGVICKDLRDG